MKESQIVNMSDPAAKRELMIRIGPLQGLHEVLIKPRKRTRSLNQNDYYWVAVASVFAEYLREQYGDPLITKEQAHEVLKRTILGMKEKYVNGAQLLILPDSRFLSTEDYSVFIEGCIKFLAEFANIVVVPSELFYEGATLPKNPKQSSGR